MRQFDYRRSDTLDDVIVLLGNGASDVRPLAGGTDLLTLMKANVVTPAQLVDIKRIRDLPASITGAEGGVTIGALATLSEVETNPLVRQHAAALGEAAAQAATPQLRNRATMGGNLLQRPRCWYFRDEQFPCWLKGGETCHARDGQNGLHAIMDVSPCVAVHPSDLASALVALDAEVRLRGANGERTIPLAQFFASPTDERRTENVLGGDELITAVHVPASTQGTRSTYLKAMDRKVWAFALVGVAARLTLDASGMIADARVVLGGVAPVPWRCEAAEQALVGNRPDAALFDKAAEAAVAQARPLRFNGYKVTLAENMVRRALAALAS